MRYLELSVWQVISGAALAVVTVAGLLVLASEEAKRFYAGMGTLYLERLGQLIGAALVRMQG